MDAADRLVEVLKGEGPRVLATLARTIGDLAVAEDALSEATITALTRDDLVATHDAWIRPDNATIFVVSDLPLAQVTPQLEAAFGDWRAPSAAKGTKDFSGAVPATTSRIVLIDPRST